MDPHFAPLIPLFYILISLPYVGLGVYAWSRRPGVALLPFTCLMAALAVWSFSYGLDILLPDLPRKLFLAYIESVSVAVIPIFLPAFVFEFSGRSQLLTRRNWILLALVPTVAVLAALTNSYHGLAWTSARIIEASGLFFLTASDGPISILFYGYSYLIVLIITALLIYDVFHLPGFYRHQAVLLVLGILAPHIGGVFYFTKFGPIAYLDLTPIFFIPTAIALYWAITRYQLLDVIPLAHTIVLQNIGDGVIVVDERQRLLYMNPTAEMILVSKESHSIGQPLENLSMFAKKLAALLHIKEGRDELSFEQTGNAPIFEVTHSPMYLLDKGRPARYPGTLILLHDITLRKETETALQRHEALLNALRFTAEEFLKQAHWEMNIPQVLKLIGEAADVSRMYVFINYQNDYGILHTSQCYEWAAPGVSQQIDNPELQHMSYRKAGYGELQHLLSRGEPVHGNVTALPVSMRAHLSAQDNKSIALMPVFVDKAWWGFIGFDECRSPRRWTEVELSALRTTASLFGAAESRARAENKLIQRQRSLDIRHEIVQVSLETEDLQAIYQNIVDSMVRLLAASNCFLDLWDQAEKRLIPLAASTGKFKDSYPSYVAEPGIKPLSAIVVEQGQVLVVEDALQSPYTSAFTTTRFPASSVLGVPLNAIGNLLGAILLTYDQPHRFTADEIKLGEQAASLAALVLARAEANERARRRAEESETLRKAGMVVAETLHADEAVDRILVQLEHVLPYDSASVQLLEDGELKIVGGRGWDDPSLVVGLRFQIPGDNPNTAVIQSRQPLLLNNADNAFPSFHNPPHSHIHSWLGVPLVVRNQVVGLLSIDSSKPDHFTQDSVQLASAFAAQVAVALENARLFEQAETQAITDALTGLLNRRGLFELGKVELARALRLERPFSVIMIDLDHFKRVNDKYGHEIGDRVLQEVSARCGMCIRETDFLGRYGGEELVILLPETSGKLTAEVAERLRAVIGDDPVHMNPDLNINITASLGVACRDKDTETLEILIGRADQALYSAKRKGRNRVEVC